MPNSKPRLAYSCRTCGGRDVGWDAIALWCEETQQPILGPTFDAGYCSTCGHDVKLNEIQLPDAEHAGAEIA